MIKRIAPNALIIEAANGQQALDYCRQNKPDLILMDVQMPEMNGYEATREIRSLTPSINIPIIALTAGNVKSEKEKCFEAGMDDFILKPIVESTLALAFEKWLLFYDVQQASHLHYDKNAIAENAGHDERLIKEIIKLTKHELTESANKILECIREKSLKGLNAIGHKLYGTAVTSGLMLLSEVSNELAHLEQFKEQEVDELNNRIQTEIKTCLKLMG